MGGCLHVPRCRRVARWVVVALLFAGPVAADGLISGRGSPTVIMISLDGTRPADVDLDTLPTLVGLAEQGTRAAGLVPATPSNTFPAHVTLVTGVGPDRHGIVNNFFIDPRRGMFRKKDIPSWLEVEPLWSYLEGRGVVTASYHWVGSEGPWRSGRGPTHWRRFSPATPTARKVDTILDWLDLADPQLRPRFITCWFPGADHVAHRDGPGSTGARHALALQEVALRALVDGIQGRRLWESTTLLVVSDHGMAKAAKRVDFDHVLEAAGVDARVTGLGGFASVYLDHERFDAAQRQQMAKRIVALAAAEGLEAVASGPGGESPFRNPRFGDLVVRAPLGTAIYRPGLPSGGFHGYASHQPEMHGLFIAAGRGVGRGRELPALRAVDIAPTLLRLLDIEVPPWMEGVPIALEAVVAEDAGEP